MGKQKEKNNGNKHLGQLINWKWVVTVFVSSFSISIVLSLLSSEGLNYLNVALSCLVLFFFIAIGVAFDIIGLAVATASVDAFLAMAARKVRGGQTGVALIKNADRVSSFCNDVIGDIAGVVSGATATALAIKVAVTPGSELWVNLLICGIVSALTVGLKAMGKSIGMHFSHDIVLGISIFLSFFNREEKRKKHTPKKKR